MRCPVCNTSTLTANTRLIQDDCGHFKCRLCLLQEENGCRMCELQSTINPIGNFNYPLPPSESPDYEGHSSEPLELTINKIPDILEMSDLPQSNENEPTIDENNMQNLQIQNNCVTILTNENVSNISNAEENVSNISNAEENQNVDKQNASTSLLITAIDVLSPNDSNDSHCSSDRALVIDEDGIENIENVQDKNVSNEISLENNNETNENQIVSEVNPSVSSPSSENLSPAANAEDETSSGICHRIPVIKKNLALIGGFQLEESGKSNSDLTNKTPKHLATSQESRLLDSVGSPYKSPAARLSDYLIFNKLNAKDGESPLSLNHKSPGYRLSDYLVFNDRPSQDGVSQRIEKTLNEEGKSNDVTSDGFLVKSISAGDESTTMRAESDLQNNSFKETDTATDNNSSSIDTSTYPILKKRYMLNSTVDCNQKQSQIAICNEEGTNSLSLKQSRSKNGITKGDEDKENKKKLKEEKATKKSTIVKSLNKTASLKKVNLPLKSRCKNVNSLKTKSKKRKKKVENDQLHDEPVPSRKGERKKKRKVSMNENEVSEATPKKKRQRRSASSKRKSKKDWWGHLIRLPGNQRTYRCTVCDTRFNYWRGRHDHAACRRGKPPFHCETCDRSFYKRTHFEYHKLEHAGEKPYACEVCQKRFYQKGKLNRHLLVHNKQPDVKCDVCEKKFSSKQYLIRHLVSHQNNVFKCSQCPKAFSLDANRKRHELGHTAERTHVCNICPSKFKSKYLLTRHKKLHDKDRPFTCERCRRVFLLKFELQRHITSHSETKPFACQFCDSEFRRKDNLKRHVKHHHTLDFANSAEEDQRLTPSELSTPEEIKEPVKNPEKPKKKSKKNPSRKISSKSSKNNESTSAMPNTDVSKIIPPNNPEFIFAEDMPRDQVLLVNARIESKLRTQKSFCGFPGLTKRNEKKQSAGPSKRLRSNSKSKDTTTSKENQEKQKTGNSNDEESRQKDTSYVHWRRRTAETLRSNLNKKSENDS